MEDKDIFRTAIFGGYQKEDVTDYIRSLENENETIRILANKEKSELRTQLEKEKARSEELKHSLASLQDRIAALEKEGKLRESAGEPEASYTSDAKNRTTDEELMRKLREERKEQQQWIEELARMQQDIREDLQQILQQELQQHVQQDLLMRLQEEVEELRSILEGRKIGQEDGGGRAERLSVSDSDSLPQLLPIPEETAAEEEPAEEALAEEAPFEEAPAEGVPVEREPAMKSPIQEAPVHEKAMQGKAPAGETARQKRGREEIPASAQPLPPEYDKKARTSIARMQKRAADLLLELE